MLTDTEFMALLQLAGLRLRYVGGPRPLAVHYRNSHIGCIGLTLNGHDMARDWDDIVEMMRAYDESH